MFYILAPLIQNVLPMSPERSVTYVSGRSQKTYKQCKGKQPTQFQSCCRIPSRLYGGHGEERSHASLSDAFFLRTNPPLLTLHALA